MLLVVWRVPVIMSALTSNSFCVIIIHDLQYRQAPKRRQSQPETMRHRRIVYIKALWWSAHGAVRFARFPKTAPTLVSDFLEAVLKI
jgi:hypothetical protein